MNYEKVMRISKLNGLDIFIPHTHNPAIFSRTIRSMCNRNHDLILEDQKNDRGLKLGATNNTAPIGLLYPYRVGRYKDLERDLFATRQNLLKAVQV